MKPPSFIAGGIGMIALTSTDTAPADKDRDSKGDSTSTSNRDRDRGRGEKHFQFVYSAEFARLHDQYNMLASTGDVNRLATFISHHPYHPEGTEQIQPYPVLSCAILCHAMLYCTVLPFHPTISSTASLHCLRFFCVRAYCTQYECLFVVHSESVSNIMYGTHPCVYIYMCVCVDRVPADSDGVCAHRSDGQGCGLDEEGSLLLRVRLH